MSGAGLQAFYRRAFNHLLGTRVQAVKLSPYRAGLAEPALQRFQTVAALPTCCCPPGLSLRGGSVGPRTSSESFPIESGILCRVTRRTVALAIAIVPGVLVGWTAQYLYNHMAKKP